MRHTWAFFAEAEVEKLPNLVKRPYLVVHDYETGGLWAYVWAESEQQIARKLDVEIVSELPEWLVESRIASFDIDGLLPDWVFAEGRKGR